MLIRNYKHGFTSYNILLIQKCTPDAFMYIPSAYHLYYGFIFFFSQLVESILKVLLTSYISEPWQNENTKTESM